MAIRNLNVPVDAQLYDQITKYKDKIGAKTWQDYFRITSSDPEGDVEANILGVQVKVGLTVYNYETAKNVFAPKGRLKPSTPLPELLQVTFGVNDYVYAFSPLDPQRYHLINKFVRR